LPQGPHPTMVVVVVVVVVVGGGTSAPFAASNGRRCGDPSSLFRRAFPLRGPPFKWEREDMLYEAEAMTPAVATSSRARNTHPEIAGAAWRSNREVRPQSVDCRQRATKPERAPTRQNLQIKSGEMTSAVNDKRCGPRAASSSMRGRGAPTAGAPTPRGPPRSPGRVRSAPGTVRDTRRKRRRRGPAVDGPQTVTEVFLEHVVAEGVHRRRGPGEAAGEARWMASPLPDRMIGDRPGRSCGSGQRSRRAGNG